MILVTGATGNVGGAVVRHLVAAGADVRAFVRAQPSEPDAPGVQTAVGDLSDLDTVRPALVGVTGMFLLSGYPDPAGLFAAARDAGVRHVTLLGSSAATDADTAAVRQGTSPSTNAVVAYNAETDRALRESGLRWTLLRPVGFHANALRWLPQLAAGDVIRGPWPDVAIASIDPDDIGAVAAVTLQDEGWHGAALRVTGPRALTPGQRVRQLGAAIGRPLRFEAQSDDDARAEMLADGTPPAFVDAFFRFFSQGETDETTVANTVEVVTGRSPRSFADWADSHAADFAQQ